VSGRGIETDDTKAITSWPVPTKLREVRGFLGLCGYYQRFVNNFSEIAAPLHSLTKNNATFQWTTEGHIAFDELKDRLTKAPILALPGDEGTYVLDTDASEHGIGAVLSQVQDGEEKVISYASRLYSAAEKRYCVTRKELLAIVFFPETLPPEPSGQVVRRENDHAALLWLIKTPQLIGRQSRWLEILKEFQFNVEHRPGLKHSNAEALSRRPCRLCGMCMPETSVEELLDVWALQTNDADSTVSSTDAIREAQEKDADIGLIYKVLTTNENKPSLVSILSISQEAKVYWTRWGR